MKKLTKFISVLTLLILTIMSSESYAAIYSSKSECNANCSTSCGDGSDFYVCFAPGNGYCVSDGVWAAGPYQTFSDCQYVENSSGDSVVKSCYKEGSYYRYHTKNAPSCGKGSCPANCSSCSSSSVCTTCNSGYYLSSGGCVACPSNATCNGASAFTCNSGYKKSGAACIKDTTVSSCPSRMKLSSDGCCCINK